MRKRRCTGGTVTVPLTIQPGNHYTVVSLEEGGGRPPIDCTTPDARWQETPQRGATSSTYAERRLTPRSVCARPDSHSTVTTTGSRSSRIPSSSLLLLSTLSPASLCASSSSRFTSPPPQTGPLNREILNNAFNFPPSSALIRLSGDRPLLLAFHANEYDRVPFETSISIPSNRSCFLSLSVFLTRVSSNSIFVL